MTAPQPAAANPASASPIPGDNARRLIPLMMAMFFAFGFCTNLVDTLVPKFKAMFTLSYAEVMLTQFCFFGAYFLISAPAGWLIGRIGYLRSLTLGLGVMAGGAALFAAAAWFATYPGFLAALFVLASGITILQVAANPVVAVAGPAATAPSRLTLAQALNSFATFIGPTIGAILFLSSLKAPPARPSPAALATYRHAQAHVFLLPFLAMAIALMALGLFTWSRRAISPPVDQRGGGSYRHLLGYRRLLFGVIAIFTYVGAEVAIGSAMANYLMQASVLGVAAVTAGKLVSLYWGGAMVGRFLGTLVLRKAPPGLVLALCAVTALALTLASSASHGRLAALCLLAVGLANSIQFPTIFTLAIEGLGDDTPEASGLICLAIVGGAIIPLLTGTLADRAGLATALLIPALCYAYIAIFGTSVWRNLLKAGRFGRGGATRSLVLRAGGDT